MPKAMTDAEIEAFKQQLIDAADQLVRRQGSARFTMRELAAAVGCSPMLPYRYFKDREEIVAAVRTRGFQMFAEALEGAARNETEPADRSRNVGDAYVAFAVGNPEIYRLIFDTGRVLPGRYPALDAAAARARRTMTGHVTELVRTGRLQGDPKVIGHLFWASLHGLIMLRLAGQLQAKPGFDQLKEAMTAALVHGLRPRSQ